METFTPESTPEYMPESTPEYMHEYMPGLKPESMSESTSESTPESMPESTPGLTPESTPESTPGLTPESTPESPGLTPVFTPDNTFIGIFTPMERHLQCEQKGVRNYVTADIPRWKILKDIDIGLFSNYGFTHYNNYLLSTGLNLADFPDDKWLLCPIQLKDKSSDWDIQIGMSGKCKQGQTEFDGMLLELEEELGLKYNSRSKVVPIITKHTGYWYEGSKRKEYTYSRSTFKINFDNVRLIDTHVDKPIKDISDEENYFKTIACLVHGNLKDITKVLEIKKVNYSCNDDRIIGMAYVSGKTVKTIMNTFARR